MPAASCAESEPEFVRGALGTHGEEECLSKLILFGEGSLRRALREFEGHFHEERNHQGKGNVLLFPCGEVPTTKRGPSIRCHERLGGLLKY